ncbi:hypothetical protein CYY_000597 [Polysphondylium violaceum]|uniref:Ankyrin repeat protein n=1 Tax=Polysphondylium violaceum TaxID=133409 RepID=A0A8J4Q1K1_9MYCE|nr:hypothetical protein CYY_000597 [Polysphondylium violaceum]
MNKDLYSRVFNNKYLSTKIFNIIHDVQIDRYSLKYEDIVDIGWMFRNGHLGVAKEKINNKQILYIDHGDLFSIVANTDTNLFISLYEQNRYTARGYLVDKKNVILDSSNKKYQLKNKQVIKYLYDREFKDDILEQLVVAKMDPEVIEYLLEIGWFRVSIDLIKREFHPSTGYRGLGSPPKVLELLLKNFRGPIPLKDSIEIIRSNIAFPIPTDLSLLLPLFHPDIRDEIFEQIDFDHVISILDQKNNQQKRINQLKSMIPIVVVESRDILVLETYAMWSQWTREGGQDSFFNLWNTNVNRIRVRGNHIYYHTKNDLSPLISDEFLIEDTNVVDIGDFLKGLACAQVSLSILQFLHNKGLKSTKIRSDFSEFYNQLAKLSNKKDIEMIVTLSSLAPYGELINRIDLLKACCRLGLIYKFKYYYELFKKENHNYIWNCVVPILFKEAANHGQYHMYRVIESFGQESCMNIWELTDFYNQNSFKCFEKEVDKIINSDGSSKRLFLSYVQIGIKFSDFIGVKTLFNKYLSNSLDEKNFTDDKMLYEMLGETNNLTIIDYLSKHQSLFFKTTCSIQAKSFFKNVLEKAVEYKNLPLVEYLLKYQCLETNDLSTLDLQFISEYFDENNNIIIK